MKITIQNKGAESAPIVIDTNSRSTENTTLNFPKLRSMDTGISKPFNSIEIAMKSAIMRSLISEIKGWMKRQSKYRFASKQEALENKQAVLNRLFSYDRATASNNTKKIEFAKAQDIPLVLAWVGCGSSDYVLVFCPLINSENDKVIYKPCGHFYISNSGGIEDTTYESLIASQESFIDDMMSKILNS